jgi:adenylate cyclase
MKSPPRRVERRLAAILAVDVAGYSRLMGADEEGTLDALHAVRRELGDPKIELQDQVASSVAGAIKPKLRQSEIERASRKPTANLTAYDFYLRALAQSYRYTDDGLAEAVALARQALAIDPSYSPAAALVGWCRGVQRIQGWGALSAEDIGEACRLARQAREAERDNAETIWQAA